MEPSGQIEEAAGKSDTDVISLPYIALRIAAAREDANLTQSDMAAKLGCTRQNFAYFESGEHRVRSFELEKIAESTGKDVWFFLDPFRVVSGEAKFSYRLKDAEPAVLKDTDEHLGKYIALWRHLAAAKGESPRFIRQSLELTVGSSFEDADKSADAVRRQLELGDCPAERLLDAVEKKEGILVLHLDLPKGVSGAAARVAHGDTILINRSEPATRRAFDLAHELFHLLTWDTMLPEREDTPAPSGYQQKRIEQLANVFARTLLMPSETVLKEWRTAKEEKASLREAAVLVARKFGVSCSALGWRLFGLREITDVQRAEMDVTGDTGGRPPLPFSKPFLELLAWGIDEGKISARAALKAMGLTNQQLKVLLAEHAIALPADL